MHLCMCSPCFWSRLYLQTSDSSAKGLVSTTQIRSACLLRDKCNFMHLLQLVEKSSFILCTFVYPRCYGRLKYSKIQRTNGIENIVYFTRVVTNERKFSWRWNIVAKLLQGMKNNLWKNESKIIFRCLVRALWKCTESPIEIMQIRYVLADFERSYFLPK